MSYERVTWADGETALSAEHMNNIEEGIGEALLKAQGNTDMWSYIRNLVYPVGSIYMTASLDTVDKVSAALGGTWEAWGSGRVPVGVGTSDREFAADETGGASTVTLSTTQIPSHNHTYDKANSPTGSTKLTKDQIPLHSHTLAQNGNAVTVNTGSGYSVAIRATGGTETTGGTGGGQGHTHTISTSSTNSANTGGGQAHSNLQPYITCYMYKRIA